MKRLFVSAVSVSVFMVTFAALAGVTMSDIWRWGLLRNTDILPVGSTITYMTGGVLRVVEAYDQTDTNRFRMTVSTPLVDGVSAVLSNGVYESASISNDGFTLSAAFFNGWILTYTPTPTPAYGWQVSHGALTNGTNFVSAATNFYCASGFGVTNAGDYSPVVVTLTGTSFVVSAYTNWTFEITNGVDVGAVTNLTLVNPYDTNSVVLSLVYTNWAAPYFVLTNSAGTNGNAWGASNTLDSADDLITGIAPTGGVALGTAWVGYRRWVSRVTNDFFKAAAADQALRLNDSSDGPYYTTIENGTGTVWRGVISTNYTVTVSSDFEETAGHTKPVWTVHEWPFGDIGDDWCGVESESVFRIFSGASPLWSGVPGTYPLLLSPVTGGAGSAVVSQHIVCVYSVYHTFATSGDVSTQWVNTTNFVQDAIDDLRTEISEAIEAHVELLHP